MPLLGLLLLFPAAVAQPLLIAAASDLAPLEKPLSQALEKASGVSVRFVFGSSGMLAAQIRNGAPYDVYLSANLQFARQLEASQHLQAPVVTYATGRLAFYSQRLRTLDDLASPAVRHLAIANPAHAPYGVAAVEMLKHRGLWQKLEAKVVYAENVRQALQFAEQGNADAAIVAWTLAMSKGGTLLPDSGHAPILQAGGVVAKTSRPEASAKVLRYLESPTGRDLLRRFGLFPPP